MKKRVGIFLLIIYLLSINVYAKDTIYSRNKNENEKFLYIKETYNKESKNNGFVLLGKYEENNTILVRYNKLGNIKWTNEIENTTPKSIEYSYNDEDKVDGYIIALKGDNSNTLLQKIDIDGNLVWQEEYNIENLEKIIISYNNNGEKDGYILVGDRNEIATILKIDKGKNIVLEKEFPKEDNSTTKNIDITYIKKDNIVTGYSILREIETNNEKRVQLLTANLELEETVLKDSINKYEIYKLETSNNGFVLYGITSDIKVSGGDYSYYIIHYNENNEEDWETLGDTPTDKNKSIVLLKSTENDDYFLFYTNEYDSSYEVVKIKSTGEISKKIKKINNDYYDIESFYMKDDILYLIGQINCPEDDNCEYDNNSLFLVSDEDTVIEVKETDNGKVITLTILVIVLLGSTILIHKKRRIKKV